MVDDEYDIIADDLDAPTCWRLLVRSTFGRVGLVADNEVVVLPVNITAFGERIVFRTAAGSTLATSGDGSLVAFEVDETDRVLESGWSVLVRGRLWDVTDRPETATWNELLVRPWAPPPNDRWMVIEPTVVTGKTIQRRRNLIGRLPYMSPD